MCFKKDLEFGQTYQELAKKYIGDEVVIDSPVGLFKDYDFKTNVASYEVKSDRLAYKYGCQSMFIEFECNGKESGIASTKADYWFYFMVKPEGFVLYKLPVDILKDRCLHSRILGGGDNGKIRGYIVLVSGLEKYMITS
jgi:hypothetical protein